MLNWEYQNKSMTSINRKEYNTQVLAKIIADYTVSKKAKKNILCGYLTQEGYSGVKITRFPGDVESEPFCWEAEKNGKWIAGKVFLEIDHKLRIEVEWGDE